MIIIISCLMGPGTLEGKLVPLSKVGKVKKIYVLRKYAGPEIDKVEYILLPKICRTSFFNLILTPLILAFYTFKVKAKLILSYHVIPHGFFAYIAALLTSKPFNISQTGLYIQKYCELVLVKPFLIHILKQSSFINVPGEKSKRFWISKGIAESKIHTLHSKIDSELFQYSNQHKEYDFIYLGRLSKEKRINIIIEGIFHLKSLGLITNLVIVGDGAEMESLKSQVELLNLASEIRFVGFVDNPADWLNRSRIFLLSSGSEGLPTALMQAMSCKLLAISSNVGNIQDLVVNNVNGFLFDPSNIGEFFKLIEHCYRSYEDLSVVRENARLTVLEKFRYEVATQEWDKILQNV